MESKLNYIGSKRKLAPLIYKTIHDTVPAGTFCDLFAGTGAVSEVFSKTYSLIVNDWEKYSYYINYQKFGTYVPDANKLSEQLEYLNTLDVIPGFIAEHYSPIGSERMYFTEENASKIDTIRFEISEIATSKEEEIYLIALLLEAADKVANVASVYGAYLKKFKASAEKNLIIKDLKKFSSSGVIYQQDANELDVSGEVVYLDPPYNTRHYGSNYHMLNTIVDYNYFEPKGKTGLPEYKKSDYCSKVKIKLAFESLIKSLKFKDIFISYNNEGILSQLDFEIICEKYGKFNTLVLDSQYQRFKADNKREQTRTHTVEYLYHISK